MSTFCVKLRWGLGNRINGILNRIEPTRSVLFGWDPSPQHCDAEWHDLFSTPLEVTTSDKFPPGWLKLPYNCFYHESEHKDYALGFLRSLRPSEEVRSRMIDLPLGTEGWHIRSLSEFITSEFPSVRIPSGAFLACDNPDRLELGSGVLRNPSPAYGTTDRWRTRDMMISAAADWFTLMQCSRITHVGLPFNGFLEKHSTFTDAHRLLGIPVTAIAAEELPFGWTGETPYPIKTHGRS
jgi:hypothetical protein